MADPGTQQALGGPDIGEGGAVEVVDVQFDERRHRATTARTLAYLLWGLLAGAVLVQYGLTLVLLLVGKEQGTAALEKLFNALLPILSGLVGGATTYYFTKGRA
jgi:hypothetical protein